MAMQLLETIEVGAGGASSMEFTGIPSTGLSLLCLVNARASNTGNVILTYFNGDTTGSNYDSVSIYADGTTASSSSNIGFAPFALTLPPNTTTANTFGNGYAYIPNYTSSSTKTLAWESGYENAATAAKKDVGRINYSGTSPITSFRLTGSFAQYSTASLYIIS